MKWIIAYTDPNYEPFFTYSPQPVKAHEILYVRGLVTQILKLTCMRTWDAQRTTHKQLQGTIITFLETKEMAICTKICKRNIRTAMAIYSLPVSRNLTPITCRQVYWLYHWNSFVYIPVLNPTSSACLKIRGASLFTQIGE